MNFSFDEFNEFEKLHIRMENDPFFFFFFDISAMKEIVTDASTVARLQIVQMIHCCPVHTDLCSI